jgi:adenine-specific DNA-methyltransferase
VADNYDDYSREELLRELRLRDRRPRFGLVWERKEIEHEQAVNNDFVALNLDPALSCGEAPYRNLIIEGDNFDALRYLRMTHTGKIKCIYIDPPYNTGNRDFIYNDRFVDKEDAYRHSKWLEFMYRRLLLARELLAEDGVIFVSIDDNEVFNLGLLMNSIFGESNHVATCVWQKRYSRENRGAIGDAHEYLLIYALNPEIFKYRRNKVSLTDKQTAVYKNDHPAHGKWRDIPMTAQGFRPNQMYEIVAPNGKKHRPPEGRCWSMIEAQYQKKLADGRIYFGKDGNGTPRVIRYLSEVSGVVPWTWWPHEEVGHTDEARKEIQSIFGSQTVFDTPKPVRLIERILRIATKPDDLVLDFFAGSGTTAHAVMKLNAEDGGNRRYILVSSTEATATEPDKNLCRDVCAERVRRIAQGYINKKGEKIVGLRGDFAYLRTQRLPAETLFYSIQHEHIWLAVQLIHGNSVSLYVPDALMQQSEQGDTILLYLPQINEAVLQALSAWFAANGKLLVYAWQPGLLQHHFGNQCDSFLPIPQVLIDRFGAGSKA